MTMKAIAEAVNTVAASASVDLNSTNFKWNGGGKATLVVLPTGSATQAGNVEVSDDGSTWTTAYAYAAGVPVMKEITLKRYVRVNNTAGTVGSTSFYLLDA